MTNRSLLIDVLLLARIDINIHLKDDKCRLKKFEELVADQKDSIQESQATIDKINNEITEQKELIKQGQS